MTMHRSDESKAERTPAVDFLSSEALGLSRKMEGGAADQMATRFLSLRNELVARAALESLPVSAARGSGFRLAFAAAATLVIGLGVGAALWNQHSATPANYLASNRTVITDSASVGPSAIAAALTLEARIMEAKAGSVIELPSGSFETAMTLRKPVRLVAVDGVVRIGVNASRGGAD